MACPEHHYPARNLQGPLATAAQNQPPVHIPWHGVEIPVLRQDIGGNCPQCYYSGAAESAERELSCCHCYGCGMQVTRPCPPRLGPFGQHYIAVLGFPFLELTSSGLVYNLGAVAETFVVVPSCMACVRVCVSGMCVCVCV